MPDLEQDPEDRAASFDSETSYFLVSLDLGELSRVVPLWFKFPSGFVNQLAIKAHDAIYGESPSLRYLCCLLFPCLNACLHSRFGFLNRRQQR